MSTKQRIETFWVVIKPTDLTYCMLVDIVFESTPQSIGRQFLGGLHPSDVVGFYKTKYAADLVGLSLLGERDGNKFRDEQKAVK